MDAMLMLARSRLALGRIGSINSPHAPFRANESSVIQPSSIFTHSAFYPRRLEPIPRVVAIHQVENSVRRNDDTELHLAKIANRPFADQQRRKLTGFGLTPLIGGP